MLNGRDNLKRTRAGTSETSSTFFISADQNKDLKIGSGFKQDSDLEISFRPDNVSPLASSCYLP